MENIKFSAEIAGITIQYSLKHPALKKTVLINYPESFNEPQCFAVADEELMNFTANIVEDNRPIQLEFSALPISTSEALLPHGVLLMHAVAFMWHGKAWLFTARSGTGKTTQYYRWKELYGDEVQMINGDKPAIKFLSDGEIWVHNTPWQGKESMGNCISAPLGGIVFLTQAKENEIVHVPAREAIVPVFEQLIFRSDRSDFPLICSLVDKMLSSVPVMRLYNLGDADSARLTHDFIISEGMI